MVIETFGVATRGHLGGGVGGGPLGHRITHKKIRVDNVEIAPARSTC